MDLGCGEGRLAEHFAKDLDKKEFRLLSSVRSFDLMALKPHIEIKDIVETGLESNSCDVAVFCLSLMGTNYKEFIIEALHILRIGGYLIISEITSRFSNINSFILVLKNFGAVLSHRESLGTYFETLIFEKKDNRNPRKYNNKVDWGKLLKPCFYKKR